MSQILIYGSDHLAFRVAEQLCAEGRVVTVIARPGSWLANAVASGNLGTLQIKDFFSEQTTDVALLKRAGIENAEALFAITDLDEANLGMALAALELNPRLRVVLRQFNVRLGQLLEKYLAQCEVMSMSALAATTFALAACAPGVRFAHTFGVDTLVLREEAGSNDEQTNGKIVLAGDGPEAKRLIASTDRSLPGYPETNHSQSAPPTRRDRRTNRILLAVAVYLLVLVISASLYFKLRLGMSVFDAIYFVVITITSVGFVDFSLRDTDALSRIIGVVLMISGLGISAVFFALLTNHLVARQQAFNQGRVRQKISNHTIVCGLGVVGLRVAQNLQQRGEPVVLVEKDEGGRFVAEARHLGIPIVIGDALQEQTLRYANIAQARSLAVCSNPDHLNLEIALHARSLQPDLPVVLRMFDPDLARRVAHHFNLGTTFSSAALVAARFAAPATRSTRLCNLVFEKLNLEFHQIDLPAGESAADVAEKHNGRLIAVVDLEGRLNFDVNESLSHSSIIVVKLIG
jgi:Trk K+ transport system NAD-binding subunit